jgi:glutathione S-transferase
MVLLHKEIPFDYTEIDLANKPDWFLDVSPYGKVPALKVNGVTLYESAIINEYLDEAYPERRLLSEDPLKRAGQRILIDYISNRFVPVFYKLLLNQDEEAQEGYKGELVSHFDYFESLLEGHAWLSGDELSMTDISLLPWFERLAILERYRDFGLPASYENLHRWWNACQKLPEFQATKTDEGQLVGSYERYADGTASGSTSKEMGT